MPAQEYIYQDRIVAFIDVLGFQEKLYEFEEDAKAKKIEEGAEYLISEKVNEFINTFKEVMGILDKDNLQYYLFSDNICITVDYIENPDLVVSLLFTISELFYSFAVKGYFLRGGVDVGKFIDETKIALGVPLAKAYLLESKDAVYPRILLSEKYYTLIKDYLEQKKIPQYQTLSPELIVHASCEFYYLNVFYNVVRKEDKVGFFTVLRDRITDNIQRSAKKEKIHVKYEWLADQYNSFIENYADSLAFDENEEPDPVVIEEIKNLKI